MAAPRPDAVLCFGEILWDFLPAGLFAGGAPFNVAFHLNQLGCPVRVVSAVGADVLGDELLRRLTDWGIDTGLIARLDDTPTGYVRASIGASGDAHYEITTDVAWDRIDASPSVLDAAGSARALVFGSLAQRSAQNRAALRRILDALPAAALRIFDVNLRPPHDNLDLVLTLARDATVLKVNAAEAARLAGADPQSPGQEEAHARALAKRSGCPTICITSGSQGAGLLEHDTWHWEPGREVRVEDTVGAGDSFLASLTADLLAGHVSASSLLARACRLGEWVATQRGATPGHPDAIPGRTAG